MADSLAALGLVVTPDGELTVRGREFEGQLEMVVARGSQMISRSLSLEGTCEERAAIAAAIIERALRPLLRSPPPRAAEPDGSAASQLPSTPEPSLKPAATPGTKVGPDFAEPVPMSASSQDAEETPARARQLTLDERDPIWMLAGALVVLGGEGPTFRGGADAEVRYEMTDDLFAVVRLSYRTPRVEYVGSAEVRMDDGAAAFGVQVGAPWDALALQATAILQVAWAHGSGLDAQYSEVRANPGITVGGCYQKEFGGWGIEACVRGFGYLRRQEIRVNNLQVLELPRVGGELAVGVAYQL